MIVAEQRRSEKMLQREYAVRFNTPAFLGNAEQGGQWRTPPFKHLLREWWRVAWAEKLGYPADISAMRAEEARLFGSAADGSGNRSLVRIRLGRWDMGKEQKWDHDPKVEHPEVRNNNNKIVPVGSQLYLGYGPLAYDKKSKGTRLKANAAIQSGETAVFRIAFPDEDSALLDRAADLMSALGAVGGRSRNGWGSFELMDGDKAIFPDSLPLRKWQDCLSLEWAHAIGQDENGALVWCTGEFSDWRKLMQELARIKIALRTWFQFHLGGNAPRPEDRHWLSYPVTNHSVKPWDDMVKRQEVKKKGLGNRLPNSLRFKLRQDQNGKYYGVIFHMPCKPPAEFNPSVETLKAVWNKVHAYLDNTTQLTRGGQ